MIVKLLTEHHFEFPSLKGCCRGSFESTLNCWKSRVAVKIYYYHYYLSCASSQGPDQPAHLCSVTRALLAYTNYGMSDQNLDM